MGPPYCESFQATAESLSGCSCCCLKCFPLDISECKTFIYSVMPDLKKKKFVPQREKNNNYSCS